MKNENSFSNRLNRMLNKSPKKHEMNFDNTKFISVNYYSNNDQKTVTSASVIVIDVNSDQIITMNCDLAKKHGSIEDFEYNIQSIIAFYVGIFNCRVIIDSKIRPESLNSDGRFECKNIKSNTFNKALEQESLANIEYTEMNNGINVFHKDSSDKFKPAKDNSLKEIMIRDIINQKYPLAALLMPKEETEELLKIYQETVSELCEKDQTILNNYFKYEK